MHINTLVVRALMALRGINDVTLAAIANVTVKNLVHWLSDDSEGDEVIAFETQLEILRVLGINGETPRQDIVHYWQVHQDFFSTKKAFWAIDAMTDAFGPAEVVYFANEVDPTIATKAEIHFGLQFQSFKALLKVTAHPLRNIGFDPVSMQRLTWASGTAQVLVTTDQSLKLAPGLMTPVSYDRQLVQGREQLAWDRLNSLSRESKIGPEQLELILRNVQQGLLTAQLPNALDPAINLRTDTAPLTSPNSPVAPEVDKPPVTISEVDTAGVVTPSQGNTASVEKLAENVVPVREISTQPVKSSTVEIPRTVEATAINELSQKRGQFVPRPRRRESHARTTA